MLPLDEPHEPAYALLAPHRFAVAVDPTKTLGETMFGLLGGELGAPVAVPDGAADDDDPADSAPGSELRAWRAR